MYFGNIDRRTVGLILAACIIISLFLSGDFGALLLTIPGVIIAMTFHEFAHAWMADKLGDTTPRAQGRLTLNPASHIDPFGIVLLLFAHIGWGRPVEINPNNFTSNKSRQTCELLVALAGPVMNFILAFLFTIIYYALWYFVSLPAKWFAIVLSIVYYVIIINIGLGVFNLIPIPPLDGSKIFRRFLPYNANAWIDRNMQIIYIVFLILWVTGLLLTLATPVINLVRKRYRSYSCEYF
jgi:Zn-dependent protease